MSDRPLAGQFLGVHVDDVAEAHLRALRDNITGLRSYLLAAERGSWADVYRFVRERYPSAPFKLEPVDSVRYSVDASNAERDLGIRFKGMKEQVGDVVDQQLDLRRKDTTS